eukprot:6296030-Prymnesium_polylepis.1
MRGDAWRDARAWRLGTRAGRHLAAFSARAHHGASWLQLVFVFAQCQARGCGGVLDMIYVARIGWSRAGIWGFVVGGSGAL